MVAYVHFRVLLSSLCDGETLGCQGSDVLLSGGGEDGVVEVFSYAGEINVLEVGVLLLVGHDGAQNLVALSLSSETAPAQVQIL